MRLTSSEDRQPVEEKRMHFRPTNCVGRSVAEHGLEARGTTGRMAAPREAGATKRFCAAEHAQKQGNRIKRVSLFFAVEPNLNAIADCIGDGGRPGPKM